MCQTRPDAPRRPLSVDDTPLTASTAGIALHAVAGTDTRRSMSRFLELVRVLPSSGLAQKPVTAWHLSLWTTPWPSRAGTTCRVSDARCFPGPVRDLSSRAPAGSPRSNYSARWPGRCACPTTSATTSTWPATSPHPPTRWPAWPAPRRPRDQRVTSDTAPAQKSTLRRRTADQRRAPIPAGHPPGGRRQRCTVARPVRAAWWMLVGVPVGRVGGWVGGGVMSVVVMASQVRVRSRSRARTAALCGAGIRSGLSSAPARWCRALFPLSPRPVHGPGHLYFQEC
ncbi:hypothetical protein ABH930_007403 [Kitasatospora sp. GAS204A]|nr:hypothetical protein [Kitasatospora sp. GAS204B]